MPLTDASVDFDRAFPIPKAGQLLLTHCFVAERIGRVSWRRRLRH